MNKYGGYTLIAIAAFVLIYRFDIIIETFKGTENVPFYQLLTPVILLIAGIIIVRLKWKKKETDETKEIEKTHKTEDK